MGIGEVLRAAASFSEAVRGQRESITPSGLSNTPLRQLLTEANID